MVLGVVVLLVLLTLLVAMVSATVDALLVVSDDAWRAGGRSRATTVALVVLSGGVGGLYYWLSIRPSLSGRRG